MGDRQWARRKKYEYRNKKWLVVRGKRRVEERLWAIGYGNANNKTKEGMRATGVRGMKHRRTPKDTERKIRIAKKRSEARGKRRVGRLSRPEKS